MSVHVLEGYPWWGSLRHEGLLIAPARLSGAFPESIAPLASAISERLRRALVKLGGAAGSVPVDLLDVVLDDVCGLGGTGAAWQRNGQFGSQWSVQSVTGEQIRPRAIIEGPHRAILPVFTAEEARLGVGRGRRAVARVLEWLRRKELPLALLTNGVQWRLLYAGLDHHASVEWDTSLWFEEGAPGPQVDALRILLSPAALTPGAHDEPGPLLSAIQASRRGQAELSAELGERVRKAVELLIQAYGEQLGELMSSGAASPREIYLAATRVVMRMVVALFAEAREGLLPRSDRVYADSYSLEGLRAELDRLTRERREHQYAAWPRIQALFRLIHAGSPHPDLLVPRYGGVLFEPGSADSADGVRRVLAVLEDAWHAPTDEAVWRMLDYLSRTRVRVRQGTATRIVTVPVDFSDLSSEYIGILYEGLLDFELRRVAPDGDPVVFLALGNEPALPLAVLRAMEDRQLKELVSKMKQSKRASTDEDDAEDADADADDEEPDGIEEAQLADEAEASEEDDVTAGSEDARHAAQAEALEWARSAVVVAGLVPRPRGRRRTEADETFARLRDEAARRLISRTVLPGEWYLVRWGGTRKGSGTYYTRPQLAIPTVRRTLQPLAYDPPARDDGTADEDAALGEWTPREPDRILALKVCDPGMGSGSFLIAALRFLTDALFRSLFHHGWLVESSDRRLALGEHAAAAPIWFADLLRDLPPGEEVIRARLKRVVVERCLYGVDLDPLAVELGKLVLWIETMDASLPFGFLDHKLRVGNSLVGAWLDRFREYPALAWEREGGDKGKDWVSTGEKEPWTRAIKAHRNDTVKPRLAEWLSARMKGQLEAFGEYDAGAVAAAHDELAAALDDIHALPPHESEQRAELFRERVLGSEAHSRFKEALDAWCALWFWPADDLATAPEPATLLRPSDETSTVVRRIASQHRFFHWELEFPEVFVREGAGFDAIVGNPPWEILKPNSREFFSNRDPLYRTYGKQEALARQREYFSEDRAFERDWYDYNARFRALSNFCGNAGSPFGAGERGGAKFSIIRGKANVALHEDWKRRRARHRGYADPEHPYLHQGSADVNTYKLFLEQSHALLRRGGQLGMITPSGVYTDDGTTALRSLFLERCRWRWLFGFENRDGIFDIHRSFKFGPLIVEKGGRTDAVRTAFMRRSLEDWEIGERFAIPYSMEQVHRFSPRSLALLEIRDRRDLEVLEKIYENSVLLGDHGPDGWGITYATEFHMTNDSHLFKPRPWWEERGYKPDIYGRWIRFRGRVNPDERCRWEAGWIKLRDEPGWIWEDNIGDVALPLYEGRMIGQFDFSQKGWVSGKGRGAVWREISWDGKRIQPQFLMAKTTWDDHYPDRARSKLFLMDVTSATNTRTTIATFGADLPGNHKSPTLTLTNQDTIETVALMALLNSFVFDFSVRRRLGGTSLIWAVLAESPLPQRTDVLRNSLALVAAQLALPNELFAPQWLRLVRTLPVLNGFDWRSLWAIEVPRRKQLHALVDALSLLAFALGEQDSDFILADTDHPVRLLADREFVRKLDPKGFWRVDKSTEPSMRTTVLARRAFHGLTHALEAAGDVQSGIETFLAAFGAFPSRARPNDISPETTWAECELHARNLLGEAGYRRLMKELEQGPSYPAIQPSVRRVAEPSGADGPGQGNLFDD